MSDESRKAMEGSGPKLENYPDEDSFLEARSRWLSTVGRILALTRRSPTVRETDFGKTGDKNEEQGSGSPSLANRLRKTIEQMHVQASAKMKAGVKLGVIIDYGHGDVGSCTENSITQEVSNIEEGLELLAKGREVVLREFITEAAKIHAGIEDETVYDDGAGHFFIAQIVTPMGEDNAIVPVAGVAVWWYPESPESLEIYEWDQEDCWDDTF